MRFFLVYPVQIEQWGHFI